MKTVTVLISSLVFFMFAPLLYAMGNYVTYTSNGDAYQGYYIDKGMSAPLVLLVHDWDGLDDYEVKRANMLADMGYAVFAVDLFGKGVKADTMDARRKLTGELYQDRQKMRRLLSAAVSTAKSQGANTNNAVIAGYCFGGAAVLEFARSGADLKGFVTFHGGLTKPENQEYKQTKGKILVLHGTADTSVTMTHFAQLAEELETTGVPHEMITYSGAPHAFTVFDSSRYHQEADIKSWERFGEFLADTLK